MLKTVNSSVPFGTGRRQSCFRGQAALRQSRRRSASCAAAESDPQPAARDAKGSKEFDLKVGGRNPTDRLAWLEIVQALKAAGVAMIAPQEVAFMRERGAVILDIRPRSDYLQGFIEGAVNVPLYQPIEGWDAYKTIRRLGFAAFGIGNATEPNPTFLQDVGSYADADTMIVLVCGIGGAMDPAPGQSSVGIQSRSLIAAFNLIKEGYSNVKVLRDGMTGWIADDRDLFVLGEDAGDGSQ